MDVISKIAKSLGNSGPNYAQICVRDFKSMWANSTLPEVRDFLNMLTSDNIPDDAIAVLDRGKLSVLVDEEGNLMSFRNSQPGK